MPWVADAAAREADERRVEALVGRSVVRTRYFEQDLGAPREPAWRADGFDSLDYGVELDLDDGSTWSFIWTQAGDNEGVLAFEGQLVGAQLREDGSYVVSDVSRDSRWRDVLERAIEAVEGVWVRHTWEPDGQSDLCVLSWVLHFAGGRGVVITLGGADPDAGTYRYSHDDVAVFFSLDEARSRGILLPGDPETT